MPQKEYFGGHGKEVMASMRKRYGERAEEVFYRTAKAKKQEPAGRGKRRRYKMKGEK